jgi:TolB-like protein/tetratricopeptide (TPR) repeat protein
MSEGGADDDTGHAPGAPETSSVPSATDVFVSYASPDVAVAEAVVMNLERHGVACWIAPRDVKAGALYADAIVRAISGAKALLLVLSESSVASPHVSKEIERASSKRRPIIALRIDDAPLSPALEYFLGESQWVDARAGGMDAALAKLIAAIRDGSSTMPPFNYSAIPSKSALRSSAPSPESRRSRLLRIIAIAAGLAALTWLLADKFWTPKQIARDKSAVTASPAAAVVAPATIIPEKSVAVLPFIDMSEKKDQEYFSDGLSEELIDLLTRVPELRVPARTSSFYFKGKQTTITDIAKELGVAHVLEGSVRKNGRTIRITAQLIRADTGYHVWSQTYDRKLDDIFKVQDEIAGAVVSALRASLSTRVARGTQKSLNADSYALLMQAQYFLLRQTRDDQQKAFEYYQRAVDSDPMSAVAWAGLSRVIANLQELGELPWKKAFSDALQSAERAVALDPQLAEAHIALGKVYLNLGQDYAAAKREFDKARALDPENDVVLFWAADSALGAGDLANAEELLRQAVAKDPLDGETYILLGQTYYYEGRFVEGEHSYRKALDLIPTRPSLHSSLGLVLLAKGEHEEALREINRETDVGARDATLASAYQILGRIAEARSALAQLEAERGNSDAYSIAQSYALRGDRERTFLWLDRAYEQHEYLMHLKSDPWFSSVRGDPRYKALLGKMNLPE